jgi:hypothetical protein
MQARQESGSATAAMTDRSALRIFLAFLLAPAVVPTIVALLALFPSLNGMWAIAIFMAAASYAVTLVAGVPLFLLLRSWQLLTWWAMTICGALLSILPSLFLAFAIQYHPLIGAVTGFAFWCIAFARKRPSSRRAAVK